MMWMMGYNDGVELNNIQDPFTAATAKLRPLMPRPATTSASPSTTPPCLNPIHGTDLFTLNHHFAAMAEQNKREINRQQVVVSSRWNPTPEQLQTLEELYRRGTRTPSADQIQHITSQLRRYGKIEGKNVFYWFQNHKARERQKRRRRLETLPDEKPEPEGANRTSYEVEQTKNWASPTNSSTVAAEKTLSAQIGAESKADEELQHRKNATWQMMHNLSCSTSLTNLINPSSTAINPSSTVRNPPHQDFIFINNIISMEPYNAEINPDPSSDGGDDIAQTLELFPLRSTNETLRDEEGDEPGAEMCSDHDSVTPCQFFEFLPLKN